AKVEFLAFLEEESQDIVEAAGTAILNLLPTKSRNLYDKASENGAREKKVQTYTENVMLAYLHEKSNEYKSSTVWAQYSMLKSCMIVYDNIDISKYAKLIAFLKRNSDGYIKQKNQKF
ncbi:hypothetical protein NQ317_003300, partial [Molorchus minor]